MRLIRIWAVTRKEFLHVLRDARSLGMAIAIPMLMLMSAKVRNSAKLLGAACLMVILGVVLNRLNVFIIGYHPPYTEKTYFPSITEFALSMGLVASLMLTWRVAVTYLPILEPAPKADDLDHAEEKAS